VIAAAGQQVIAELADAIACPKGGRRAASFRAAIASASLGITCAAAANHDTVLYAAPPVVSRISRCSEWVESLKSAPMVRVKVRVDQEGFRGVVADSRIY